MGNFNRGMQAHSNGLAATEMVLSGSDQPTNGQNSDTPGKPLHTLDPLLAANEWVFDRSIEYSFFILFLYF